MVKDNSWGEPRAWDEVKKSDQDPFAVAARANLAGRPDEAEAIMRSLDQRLAAVQFNLGWHEVRHGYLSKGVDMLNAGRWINCYGSPRIGGKPIWNPAEHDLRGKTILLRSEGGYGDEIINARFARDLAAIGARVVVSCCPTIMSVFARMDGVSACVSSEAVAGAVHFDYYLPAMSAPGVLGVEFPGCAGAKRTLSGEPYLWVDPDLVSKWRGIVKGKIKIGIRWKGSPKFEHQQHRVFDPAPLFALESIEGVRLYSLQRDEGCNELPADADIADLAPLLTSWEETAAAIECMDIVISSCTGVAHLAAAMGKPTWIIVPIMPYYCWSHQPNGDPSTSPWYDSCRLFRQEKFGEWDAPLLKVRAALQDFSRLGRCVDKCERAFQVCDGGLQ